MHDLCLLSCLFNVSGHALHPELTVSAEMSFVDARMTRRIFPQGAEWSETSRGKEPNIVLGIA